MNKLLLSLFLLLSLVHVTQSCSCMPQHPQNAFCSAEFVIRVKILSEAKTRPIGGAERFKKLGMRVPKYSYYKAHLKKIYKGKNKIAATSSIFIYTYAYPSSCVVNLDKGSQYLLTGRHILNKLHKNESQGFHIGFCDWREKWQHVTRHVKRGLHGKYDCSCTVVTCPEGWCHDDENECNWVVKTEEPVDECWSHYRSCRRAGADSCRWISYDNTPCEKADVP